VKWARPSGTTSSSRSCVLRRVMVIIEPHHPTPEKAAGVLLGNERPANSRGSPTCDSSAATPKLSGSACQGRPMVSLQMATLQKRFSIPFPPDTLPSL
jgi:hypothetical protein